MREKENEERRGRDRRRRTDKSHFRSWASSEAVASTQVMLGLASQTIAV